MAAAALRLTEEEVAKLEESAAAIDDLAFAGSRGRPTLARGSLARELVECTSSGSSGWTRAGLFGIVLGEHALLEAEQAQADGRRGDGAAAGGPVASRTSSTSPDLNHAVTRIDRVPGARGLRGRSPAARAGAIPIGVTRAPELTIWPFTETETGGTTRNRGTRNGRLVARVAVRAGVAAALAPVALGSDGAGSIRIPAACCGLFGLRSSAAALPILPLPRTWTDVGPACSPGMPSTRPCSSTPVAGPAPGDATAAPPTSGAVRETRRGNCLGPLRIARFRRRSAAGDGPGVGRGLRRGRRRSLPAAPPSAHQVQER